MFIAKVFKQTLLSNSKPTKKIQTGKNQDKADLW